MIVMGIDPGMNKTGVAIVNYYRKNPRVLKLDVISSKSKTIHEKLLHIYTVLRNLFKKFKPQQVAIERPFVKRNPDAAMKTSWVIGIVILCATQQKAKVFLYPPAYIKKMLTGYGRASKEQTMQMLLNIYKIKTHRKTADIFDAFATLLCHIERIKK
jgi:crossover junction endodeoxyribonuclease RuvC